MDGVAIYGRGLGKSTHMSAMEQLGSLLERTGVQYIDSTERFANVARRERRLYYAQDGHFTRDGHALMARLIQEHIEANGW